MIDTNCICLTPEELNRCVNFSAASAPNQQPIEFGQQATKPRSSKEIARDNLIGKIAEIAFSKIMKENYGIDVPLDFNYYPRGQWDEQDAVINGWRIDVKGTRKGGHWMLIEWNKLNFRQHDYNLSHVYAMFSVDWDRLHDIPTGTASFEGVASLEKLQPNCPATVVLHKGDVIPGTRSHLQADNYGIPFNKLYSDMDGFVEYLTSHSPPAHLIDNFPNPYTGDTMPVCPPANSIHINPEIKETSSPSIPCIQEPIQKQKPAQVAPPSTNADFETTTGIFHCLKNYIIYCFNKFLHH